MNNEELNNLAQYLTDCGFPQLVPIIMPLVEHGQLDMSTDIIYAQEKLCFSARTIEIIMHDFLSFVQQRVSTEDFYNLALSEEEAEDLLKEAGTE